MGQLGIGFKRIVAAAIIAGALGVAPALAQDSGVSGDLERTATATPEEKLDYAAGAVEEISGAVAQAEKLMDEARKSGETEQVECLGERLSQLRALSQVTEAAQTSMQESLAQGNQERAAHEMRKIAVAMSKARQLSAEAAACTDDSGAISGNTQVTAEGGFEGEENETEQLDVDVLDQGFDAPDASPFN